MQLSKVGQECSENSEDLLACIECATLGLTGLPKM